MGKKKFGFIWEVLVETPQLPALPAKEAEFF
jgi:hypothetical protein